MRKFRVGVVGCGEIAQIMHLPYLKELPQFEIGAICDISPKVVDTVGD
jgi:predicted dehydrogenase